MIDESFAVTFDHLSVKELWEFQLDSVWDSFVDNPSNFINEYFLNIIYNSKNHISLNLKLQMIRWNIQRRWNNFKWWNYIAILQSLCLNSQSNLKFKLANIDFKTAIGDKKPFLIEHWFRAKTGSQIWNLKSNITILICKHVHCFWRILNMKGVGFYTSISKIKIRKRLVINNLKNLLHIRIFAWFKSCPVKRKGNTRIEGWDCECT